MKSSLSNLEEKSDRILDILRKNDKFMSCEDIHNEIIKQKFPMAELITILKYLLDNNEVIKKVENSLELFKNK
jgi:Fe2+ or Zn2+ uptake regulation protein